MQKTSAVLLAGLIALLAQSPAFAVGCTKSEFKHYTDDPDLGKNPLMNLASDAAVSDSCKRELLGTFSATVRFQVDDGLCPGDWCANLEPALQAVDLLASGAKEPFCQESTCTSDKPESCGRCTVNPQYAAALGQADQLLAAPFNAELAAVETKIRDGLVPTCLAPPECGSGPCRPALVKKWWEDAANAHGQKELWMKAGGFSHLLLASAFTCSMGAQKGGTCAIFSGASLMSHYCATPRFNPSAANSCTREAPGFRCADPKEFLEDAAKDGAWTVKLCGEDKQDQVSTCRPVMENPSATQERAAQKQYDACLVNGTPQTCKTLSAKLDGIRTKAAGLALGAEKKRYDKVRLSGQEGAAVSNLKTAYKRYGFEVAYFPGNAGGWGKALAALQKGDPVQASIDVAGWSGYQSLTKAPHGVVLEGLWKDGKGRDWILMRDSNFPDDIKAVLAPEVQKTYFSQGGGAISLCPPTDPDRGRCQNP